jgi:probable F420-dependent oxidoreductase
VTARLTEARGFGSVWVSDHVVMPLEPAHRYPFSEDGKPPFDPRTPFQDPFVALAFVASITSRVQLGTGVLVLPLRHPILVAKQAATLDALSGGRLVLGIGTGWMREEFDLLERDFDGRGRGTDEAIATLRACWSEDPIELGDDRFGRLAMAPKPVQRERLPVLVGGHSPAALRRAVQLGDGWYGSNVDPSAFERLAEQVRARRRVERPDSDFRVGVKAPLAGPADVARLEREYGDGGADFLVIDLDFQRVALPEACDLIGRFADELGLDDRRDTDGPI